MYATNAPFAQGGKKKKKSLMQGATQNLLIWTYKAKMEDKTEY